MADLYCRSCGSTASYADANIADSLRTCPGERGADQPRVVQHTAVGAVRSGEKHDWVEAFRVEFSVRRDDGMTFVVSDDAPYWVVDRLEAGVVHTDAIETPDVGEKAGPFVATYSVDGKAILSVEADGEVVAC